MPSTLDKLQFYFYKYFVTGFFLLTFAYVGYLAILDLLSGATSIFSSAALIWGFITAFLVKMSWGMTMKEFLEEE